MKKIANTIFEDLNIRKSLRKRKTVRGIILDGDKILLVYSYKFDDYMFPGGGISNKEKKMVCLKRELKEELGCCEVEIIKAYGRIKEKRFSAFDGLPFTQISYYYVCKIDGIGKQHLEVDEKDYGVTPTWIKISDAIKHDKRVLKDEKHQKVGVRTVLHRELKVLEKLLGDIENEKI